MVRTKLFGFVIAFLGFSSSAFARTNCPDMQGSYTSPDNNGDRNRLIKKVDYWVIPTKASIGSINVQQTLNNLASNYPSKNKPSFTCYGPPDWNGVNTCETPNGNYFNPAYPGSGINIPSKSGGIVLVGESKFNAKTGSTSCIFSYILTYRLSKLYEVGKPNYPTLPYLLLSREKLPIVVKFYGAAPQF